MINLTQTAINEIKRLQTSRKQTNSNLRITVKPGGCSGLFYHLEINDTKTSQDHIYNHQGVEIVTDESSFPYLDGLKIDYSEDLMGGGFRFNNPNAAVNCSCGQSFNLKSEK
jgi:iron-sulfur cluster assembly protein